MAIAVGSPGHWWVGWVALPPLFVSIRLLAPAKAMLAGAFWGLSLFVFLLTTGDSTLTPGVGALVLLAGVPAIYTLVGACLTRQVGFNPYLLALGWMGVELALSPLGLRNGLLAGTQGDGLINHWVGNFAGCVLVAFLVAYISASLFEGVNRACAGIDRRRYVTGPVDAARRLFPLEVPHYPSLCGKPAQPRAPPMHLGVPCA